jgi:hypothetical protein
MARRTRQDVHAKGDPFAPIDFGVTVLLGFFGILTTLGVVVVGVQVARGHGDDVSVFNFDDRVCVTAAAGPIGWGGTDGEPEPEFPVMTARGSTSPDTYEVCLQDPSFGEQLAGSAEGLLSFLLVIGGCLMVRRVIRTARRNGLFTDLAATATRRLGWFLLAMSFAWPLGARLANGIVVSHAVEDQSWSDQLDYHPWPSLSLLLIGLGILSFARILRLAVPLQEEAELTV